MSEHEIRALDARTIEQIAAGEVVERPASVVKELVENSLDAGATRIEVTIANGGVDRIRVADDGIGIPPDALRRAVDKHTTSKLTDATELAGGIQTLGFRGEALHTIGAVSRMTIASRPTGAGKGAQLTVVGGDVGSVESAGCPPGTTVDVDDLFFNTPARRSFLGTTGTEFDHVNRVVTNYALANPDVAFSLRHDDREVFATPGRGNLQETVLAVWGREVAESMLPIETTVEDSVIERIDGLVSHPETTRSRARYIATFVNGRSVRSGEIRAGILEGYDTHLSPDRYPFVVLFCTIPPTAVDVNVHPRKTEVRFEEPDDIVDTVADVILTTFRREGIIRTTAARGRGAPPETDVRSFDRGEDPVSAAPSEHESRTPVPSDTAGKTSRFRPATTQHTFEDVEPGPSLHQLPSLRILGQLAETYIVAEAEGELVLVDQHAADERIHYERLQREFSQQTLTQELVEAVDIELTGDEAAVFETVKDALEHLGFDATAASHRVVRVTGVPTILDATVAPEYLRDAVGSAIEHARANAVDELADGVLADMACHPAITGNTSLADGSMIELLERLDTCENPYACPHGRPTIIRIDADELADRFERDYPGHVTRRFEADDCSPSA